MASPKILTDQVWWMRHTKRIRLTARADLFYHGHEDILLWKYFPHHWPFLQGIYRWPLMWSFSFFMLIFFHVLTVFKRVEQTVEWPVIRNAITLMESYWMLLCQHMISNWQLHWRKLRQYWCILQMEIQYTNNGLAYINTDEFNLHGCHLGFVW